MNIKESPWLAFGALVFVCVGGLCYFQYKSDPGDTVWNDADIPPPQAPNALQVPGNMSPDTPPMGTSGAMRHRKYPTSLLESSVSIIGSF